MEGSLRHGTAGFYGSAAVGLREGKGLTFRPDEVQRILHMPNNFTGDDLTLRAEGPREPLTEFLPGPPVLLGTLWWLTGNHTFAPYILLQILLDSLAIGMLYLVLVRYSPWLAILVSVATVLNLVTMKRTLMVGYDFWPQLAVLALFLGVVQFLEGRNGLWALWVAGSVSAVVAWCRDITSLLPFVMAAAVVAVEVARRKGSWKKWESRTVRAPCSFRSWSPWPSSASSVTKRRVDPGRAGQHSGIPSHAESASSPIPMAWSTTTRAHGSSESDSTRRWKSSCLMKCIAFRILRMRKR